MRIRFLPFLLLWAATALARDFDVRPAPSWVVPAAAETSLDVPRSNVRFGVFAVLHDHQVNVGAQSTSEYYRNVRKVLSPSGVQNASELSIDFDPSYQRLVFHQISLLRDGQRIDELDPNDVRVIEKESDSENEVYDGMLTALVFLKDVRPGDIIDYSYSLDGANPILGGKYVDEYPLTASIPTRLMRHRVLWPASRTLHYRSTLDGVQPHVTRQGGNFELVWERRDVPALDIEDEIPSWFDPYSNVQLTEFSTWNEVAKWAVANFQIDEPSRAAVKALADKIRAEHPSSGDRIMAAIRFVQDDVRYLGIEMGRNSHQPHQPSVTLSKRFGDCKDKAFLLSALLRELGVDSDPALVHTERKRALDSDLPSPMLFNHVIVQVRMDGKTYWVDGTISDQGGTLPTLAAASEERALVIRPDAQALTHIDGHQEGSVLVEHTYTSTDYDSPAILEVRSTYRGRSADAMRATLATMSLDDLAKEHINRYAADQPKIEAKGKPVISDDRKENVVRVIERYSIRDLWKGGEWTYYPHSIETHLHRPDTMIRSMPLAFDYPLNLTQKLTFNLPDHFNIESADHVVETPAFRYEYGVDSSGKTVTITHSLRALADSVAVKDVPDHLEKMNEIWDDVGYRLTRPDRNENATAADSLQRFLSRKTVAWSGIGVALLVIICTSLAVGIARRRLRGSPAAFAERARRVRDGESPASAVSVRDASEIEARLPEFHCACGARIDSPFETQSARYDERVMTIVTRSCTSCGREQSLYFKVWQVA